MSRCSTVIIGVTAILLGMNVQAVRADDWAQWRGPTRDGVWRETGLVKKFKKPQLDIQWRMPIGSGYCGPTVASGRVYVTDRVVEPKQIERVHCFDAQTGKVVWDYEYDCNYRGVSYDAGPRASVLIDDGRAYSLGAMGNFICFDAAKGDVLWKKDLNTEYKIKMPVWGISASPIVDKDLIIVEIGGEGGASFVAFDKKSGKEKWHAMDDAISYSAPIIIDHGGTHELVCYTGENVVGLDPQTGEVFWKHPFPPRQMVIGIAAPVYHDGVLFITNFFDGSLLLKLSKDGKSVTKVWQRAGKNEKETDSLHSIISTPYLKGKYIYGVDSYGELRCLDLMTGDRVWESDKAVPHDRWATIHFVQNGDRMWMFNEKGELIIGKLSPKGFKEISRAKLLEPTKDQLPSRRGGVCWSHPAYADKHVFARNDKEIVCADLSENSSRRGAENAEKK